MAPDIASLLAAISFWENWGYVALAAVVVGVIGESIEEFTELPKLMGIEKPLTRISALILIAGLAGEGITQPNTNAANAKLVAFANKETVLAQKDAAEAEQRANEAKLALEKFRTPRTIDRDWQNAITAQLSNFKQTQFDIAVIPGDPEAVGLLSQVVPPIQAAGWQWIDFSPAGGPLTITYTWPGLPNVGQMGGFGIDIFVPPDRADLSPAATALAESLKRDGFCNGTIHGASEGQKFPNQDAIHIIIGKKPP